MGCSEYRCEANVYHTPEVPPRGALRSPHLECPAKKETMKQMFTKCCNECNENNYRSLQSILLTLFSSAKNSATSQGARSETNAINLTCVSWSSLSLFRYFFWFMAARVFIGPGFSAIFKTFEIPADDASTLTTPSPRPQN